MSHITSIEVEHDGFQIAGHVERLPDDHMHALAGYPYRMSAKVRYSPWTLEDIHETSEAACGRLRTAVDQLRALCDAGDVVCAYGEEQVRALGPVHVRTAPGTDVAALLARLQRAHPERLVYMVPA